MGLVLIHGGSSTSCTVLEVEPTLQMSPSLTTVVSLRNLHKFIFILITKSIQHSLEGLQILHFIDYSIYALYMNIYVFMICVVNSHIILSDGKKRRHTQ